MIGRWFWATCWMVGLVVFATPVLSEGEDGRPALDGPVFALEITNPAGRTYIDLFAQHDGPLRLPLTDHPSEAIEIDLRFEQSAHLRVVLRELVDELTVRPLGVYELPVPESVWPLRDRVMAGRPFAAERARVTEALAGPVALTELATAGLPDWSLRLTTGIAAKDSGITTPGANDDVPCGCCGCGTMTCCPNPGICIECGACGSCCCGIEGDKPRPFDDN